MRRFLETISLALFVFSTCSWSCAQQGPTQPTAILTWTQAASTGTSGPVTGNCVYRGSAAGTYALPAIFCSTAPITTYTDNTVVTGQTYHYAVTAHFGPAEGPYSNDAAFTSPELTAPNLSAPQAKNAKPGQVGELIAKAEMVPHK